MNDVFEKAASTETPASAVSADAPVVQIRGLHKSYGDNEVLRGIDLDVRRGEVVVVLGPSGSGKSTMLRCVNLLETPTSGSIVVEGVDITKRGVDINKVRSTLGMVFQQFNLFPHLSAKRNVMIAQQKVLKRGREEAERIAIEELSKVGLADRVDFMPSQLSGGQQQRVAIGRALMNAPAIILADEPTGNLDSRNSAEIMALLKHSNERFKQTLVVITHDEDIALMADRVIAIEDGRIVSSGRRA